MLARLEIKTLFLMAMLVATAALCGMIGVVIFESRQFHVANQAKGQAEKAEIETLRAKYHIVQIQQFLTDAALTGDKDPVQEAKQNFEELEKILNKLATLAPSLQSQIDDVRTGAGKLFEVGNEMVLAYHGQGKAAGDMIMKRKDTGLDSMAESLAQKAEKLYQGVATTNQRERGVLASTSDGMSFWTLCFSVFAAIATALGYSLIYRRIRPIETAVLELTEQAEAMQASSESLGKTASVLAATAAQQSSAAQQTAASIEEINAMVMKTAENAVRMRDNAESSGQVVQQGKSTVNEMLKSVEEIRGTNQKVASDVEIGNRQVAEIVEVISEIGDKTKIINDIVFQTKLLSFNASVEAARAGEHGKGFAVVAEEVGNLASLSGKAAQEISQMLATGVERVQRILRESRDRLDGSTREANQRTEIGSQTATRCGEAFESIIGNVQEVNSAAREISSAIEEQKRGLGEINRALSEFEKTTQENSRASGLTSETARQLSGQATGLNELVRRLQSIMTGKAGSSTGPSFAEPVPMIRPRRQDRAA